MRYPHTIDQSSKLLDGANRLIQFLGDEAPEIGLILAQDHDLYRQSGHEISGFNADTFKEDVARIKVLAANLLALSARKVSA